MELLLPQNIRWHQALHITCPITCHPATTLTMAGSILTMDSSHLLAIDRQTQTNTDRQTNRQTDKQTDRHTDTQTDFSKLFFKVHFENYKLRQTDR